MKCATAVRRAAWAAGVASAPLAVGLGLAEAQTVPTGCLVTTAPGAQPTGISCTATGNPYAGGIPLQNDNAVGEITGGVTLTIDAGVVVSTDAADPATQDGIALEQPGNLTLTSTGTIGVTVGGDAASRQDRDGIRLDSRGGNATITVTGTIATGNVEGDGVIARSNSLDNEDPNWTNGRARGAGSAAVTFTGGIITAGDRSTGITAGAAGSTVSVTVTGGSSILTSGATESGAIVAQNYGTAAGRNTAVFVTGSRLETQGEESGGIVAGATGGSSTVNVIGSTIATAGERSVGIGAASGLTNIYDLSAGNLIAFTRTGTGLAINNGDTTSAGAAITTFGPWAFGVAGVSRGGAITILNRGSIQTGGDIGTGIAALHTYAPLFGTPNPATAPVVIDNQAAISTAGGSAGGIAAVTLASDIRITSSGAITTQGDRIAVPEFAALGVVLSSAGIHAAVTQVSQSGFTIGGYGAITITTTAGGTILTQGVEADGIVATAVRGATTISTGASVETRGAGADGIDARSVSGAVTVSAGAAVTTTANDAVGILATNTGTGAISVTAGTVSTGDAGLGTGLGSHAIVAGIDPRNEPQTTRGNVTVTATGPVATAGDGAIGIWARSSGAGTLSVTATGGITTAGQPDTRSANGIRAETDAGAIGITTGDITTAGASAVAIDAASQTGAIAIQTLPGTRLLTHGDVASGINAASLGPVTLAINGSIETGGRSTVGAYAGSFDFFMETGDRAEITLAAGSQITVTGNDSVGAWATGAAGASIRADALSVAASGQYGVGLAALARNGALAEITIGANTMVGGGWQADLAGVSGSTGMQAAGIMIGSDGGGATLTNNGRIGALSDRAIADLARYGLTTSPAPVTITNTGTITGFVELGSANSSFLNLSSNSFNLRHFADTNGDGIRDMERVAISDFGGGASLFANAATGTLRLSTVMGAATVDPAGTYAPAIVNPAFHDIALPGVEQGQLLRLATFRNAGVITLQDAETGGTGPIAGDVLVITGGASAAAAGGGVYVSDGGALRLDTVLNEGGANSHSDLLVVDRVQIGAGGATRIFIAQAGGSGALTPNDGILLVEVRERDATRTASPAGAFALAHRVAAGAYEYGLFHGGNPATGGNVNDGNWYLRNTRIIGDPVPASPDPVTPSPVPRAVPNYRPEVPLYTAMPGIAYRLGFAVLGTFHERMGDISLTAPAMAPATTGPDGFARAPRGGWARVFGTTGDHRPGSFFDGRGPSYDYDIAGFQAGFDLARREDPDGTRDLIGLYVGYAQARADVDHAFGGPAGSITLDGYSIGGYWTHFGAPGWYLDAVAQATWFDGTARSEPGERLSADGWGLTLSLEGGYPIALGGSGWVIEPQAQLVYQRVSLDGGSDSFGRIDFQDSDALLGRVGARLVRSFTLGTDAAAPRRLTVWGRANLWHAFGDDPETTFSTRAGTDPVSLRTTLGGTWAQVGLGATGQIAENVALYASGDYAFSADGGSGAAWSGRIGIRVTW